MENRTMSAPLKLGVLLLALASLTSVAAPVMADDDRRGRGHDRGHHGYQDRDRHRDRRHDRRYDRRDAYRDGYRAGYRHDRRDDRRVYYVPPRPVYRSNHYYAPPRQVYHRGPSPWARGVRYHDHGYAPTYVVSNYHGYGLHRPPYGHGWRRDDRGNFLLVALATGIIANVVLNGGY